MNLDIMFTWMTKYFTRVYYYFLFYLTLFCNVKHRNVDREALKLYACNIVYIIYVLTLVFICLRSCSPGEEGASEHKPIFYGRRFAITNLSMSIPSTIIDY